MPSAHLEEAARLVSEFVGDLCVIALASEDRRRFGPFTVHRRDPVRVQTCRRRWTTPTRRAALAARRPRARHRLPAGPRPLAPGELEAS